MDVIKLLVNSYYYSLVDSRCKIFPEQDCIITGMEIENPAMMKDCPDKTVYEMYAIIKWLLDHSTNPLTNEVVISSGLEGQERLNHIL